MRLTMLGLHATGKTTYAAGLYAGLRVDHYATLGFDEVTGAVTTLNRGVKRLARHLAIARTDAESTETIEIRVRTQDGELHDLRVPDRSGEALRGTLHGRSWNVELLDELHEAEGVLVFVRPKALKPGEGVHKVADATPPAEGSEAGAEGDDAAKEEDWEPRMMPTDVAMVDAMQELLAATGRESLRVGVVISAWDEVEGDPTPQRWLAEHVPLLAQFLGTNSDRLTSEVFAVSVQGGVFQEPADDEEADSIEVEIDPDEPDFWVRASCLDGDGEEVELAAPIVWMLSAGG
jgi:hypothetical protein